ncbi:hypothetical protein D3C73_1409940 [compost metagenome]
MVDLLKERFISHIEVDPDVFNDPQKSTAEAIAILNKQARDNEAFFARTLPDIKGSADSGLVPDIVAGGMATVRAALAAAVESAEKGGHVAASPEAARHVPASHAPGENQGGADHELVRG